MKPREVPVVGAVLESGADDRVYDGLLLAGPVVILLVAVFHRRLGRPIAEGLAIAYVAVFVGYVLYRFADRRRSDR